MIETVETVREREASTLDKALDKVPHFVRTWVADTVEKVEAKAEVAKTEKANAKLRAKAKTQVNSLYSKAFLSVQSYMRGEVTASSLDYLAERLKKTSERAHEVVAVEAYKKAFGEKEHIREYDNLLNKVHIIDAFLAVTEYNEELVKVSDLRSLKRKQVSVIDEAKANYHRVLKGSTVDYSTYEANDLADTVKFIEKHAKVQTIPTYDS